MQFSVTFRHMEATEALKSYARERLERIKKYLPDPIAVHVVMGTERYNHRVDVNLQLHNGLQIAGHEATENMYSSIDLVVAKIERQVRRYKDKLRHHKGRSELSAIPWTHTVIRDEEQPQAVDDDLAEPAVEEEPAPEAPHVVVRTSRFHAQPLTSAQAVMQLNLLHQQFLVFRNEDSGQVNVIYRRADGSFGLIETAVPTA